ncbi:MAG: alpha-L-fucosidase [Alphaproteobacteria bacterium]|nr:MAG: alpha-L-fucosidase [Alphaproteobacteria bacterium]
MISRRAVLGGLAGATLGGLAGGTVSWRAGATATGGPVEASWASLASHYRYPDWFRDAKFGIWAHWGPQCVPEFGDWYGRLMYIQGTPFYEHHLKHYGHPGKTGMLDIIGQWTAENWQPEYLLSLYKKAGAKYIMSMANHHDNLDTFDSSHHAWNTLNVGPRRDIVGTWEKLVRAEGLRFGVSNHSGHAWHWYQVAYGYDAEGPLAGKRYDAYTLTKADGAGTWWDGLDPQDLYTGRHMVVPDGIDSISAMNAWHDAHDGQWMEHGPDDGGKYVANWLARQKELVEKYRPDIVYMDNYSLPFGQVGLEAAAHYYNQSIGWSGDIDVVMTAKKLPPEQRAAIMDDVERGFIDHISPEPWQTCTCIGSWHYDRPLYERKGYKSAHNVVQRLMDIVSKNGNLLLSVPLRGDGTIDDEEEKILAGLADWFALNGEAVHGSRPWRTYGHGPTTVGAGMHGEGHMDAFTAEDVRYMQKDGVLYAAFMEWPTKPVVLPPLAGLHIGRVTLMDGREVPVVPGEMGLMVSLPERRGEVPVPVLKIEGQNLTI